MKQTSPKNLFKKSRIGERQYRSAPGVNKSTLVNLLKSPLHYRHSADNPEPDTPAFKKGRAIHAAILEPEQFLNNWIIAPNIDRRTSEGKVEYSRFLQLSEGKETIKVDEYAEIQSIAEAVTRDSNAADLLNGCVTEKPLFWKDEETGILCKCKVDAMKPGIMIDLKTASDASTRAFTRDCIRYGYDIQAAHYINAYQTITGECPQWYFIVIEKDAPYAINILKADTGFLDYGTVRRNDLLKKLRECRKRKSWNGYGTNDLVLPSYIDF